MMCSSCKQPTTIQFNHYRQVSRNRRVKQGLCRLCHDAVERAARRQHPAVRTSMLPGFASRPVPEQFR